MGFFSDIFSTSRKEEGFKPIPQTEGQKTAEQYLMDLMGRNVTFPTAQVAGLTDIEQQAQTRGREIITGGIPGLRTAEEAARGIVTEPTDITKLPEYQGILQDAIEQGNLLTNRIGRGLQKAGAFTQTTGRNVLGRAVESIRQGIAGRLAPFAEAERSRRAGMIPTLANLATTGATLPINLARMLGLDERAIKQLGLDAEQEAKLLTLLFPFNTQAGIAGQVLGRERFAYDPGVLSPSIFSQIAGAIPFSGGSPATPQAPQVQPTGGYSFSPYSYNRNF